MGRIPICAFAALVAISVLRFAPSAHAVDGVTLINQATATNGLPGCGSKGFPIVICKSGSYRLSSAVTVATDTSAIFVIVDNVQIDLNGFAITGPVGCGGTDFTPTQCSGGSSGIGILGAGDNISVLNGVIRGMGNAGVVLTGAGGLVDSLRVTWINGAGITVYSGTVTNSVSSRNGGVGIQGGSTTITSCVSIYNAGNGFAGTGGGPMNLQNSAAWKNNGNGIFDAFLATNSVSTYNWGLGLGDDGNGYGYLGNVFYGNLGGNVSSLGTSLGLNLCSSTHC